MTILIPIHDITDKQFELYLEPCINSVLDQKHDNLNLLFVFSEDLRNTSLQSNIEEVYSKKFNELNIKTSFIYKDGDTHYQAMVNYGVQEIETNHFMILEYDDVLNPKWLENFQQYLDSYQDVKLFLPIVTHLDENQNLMSLQNEFAWAMQSIDQTDGKMEVESVTVEDLGYIRLDSIHKKMKVSLAGGIYHTQSFKEVGMFKESHKLHFDYEFILRFLHAGHKTMVIPRTGVKHINFREDSFSKDVEDNMNLDEKKFWYSLARKEYMFPDDRGIEYQ